MARSTARKTSGRKAAKAKRVRPTRVAGGKRDSASDLRKQLKSRTAELAEARALLTARDDAYGEQIDHQSATVEILKAMSASPGDAQPVFDVIAQRALRICDADIAVVLEVDDGLVHLRSIAVDETSTKPGVVKAYRRIFPQPPSRDSVALRAIFHGEIIHIPNMADDRGLSKASRDIGPKGALAIPLKRDGKVVGSIGLSAKVTGGFSRAQIELLTTFAEQAVIAIRSAETFRQLHVRTNELSEALQQQTATADVLKVISRSAFDLDAVMHTLARSAAELCAASLCGLYIREGNLLVCRGYTAVRKDQEEFVRQARIPVSDSSMLLTRTLSSGQTFNIGDFKNDRSVGTQAFQQMLGFKALLIVPLMRDGHGIGVLVIGRDRVGDFSRRHVELAQTFADQAVIAIENARLFGEVQVRTHELSEALERQTATGEVLGVISRSPSDLNPVLQAISDTAARLCGSEQTIFFRYDGEVFRILASWNFPQEVHEMLERRPLHPGHPSAIGRAGAALEPVCIPDVLEDPAYGLKGEQNLALYRATLAVPLIREGRLIGALSLNRREPGAFTQKQIELVTTFADQAVIAIENARLFNETQEALERQTATADILKVIASSPSDVQPVFDAVVLTARRLLRREMAAILLCDDDATFRPRAITGPNGLVPIRNPDPIPIDPADNFPSRAIVSRQNQHLPDWSAIDLPDEERKIREMYGLNSALYLPMLRGDACIGVLLLGGTRPGSFSAADVALAESFRDQAMIAIENSRLFNETKEALERQTATADILKVIASSPDDVQPVFQAIAERSNRLVEGFATTVVSIIDDAVHLSAFTSTTPEADGAMRAFYPRPLSAFSYGDAIRRGEIYRIVDTEDELAGDSDSLTMIRKRGWRSALWVPLLLDGKAIGIIGATRVEPGPFADHHVEMLRTFADQAVIAIQNTRLFNQTQEALERQTATADILKVIASSPDDVQPVFQAIAERSNRLVSGLSTTVTSIVDDQFELSAFTRTTPEADAALTASFPRRLSAMPFGEAILRGEIYSLPDTETEPALRDLARLRGYRSMLFVPLLHDGASIGMIGQTRVESGPFAANHVEMLKTFADQAVIAISNVKLFKQVQERTRELSQSLDDLRSAQDRLVQTEKLASLGQLTAGIAHEIKNPLNFINNFSALSAELVDEMDEILSDAGLEARKREDLDEIRTLLKGNLEKVVQHGKRADSIVKNMLLHSRSGAGEQRLSDVNALVDESLNLAYHGARAEKQGFNITLQRDFDPAVGTADIYPQEITRVVLNLITNGFYAASRRATEAGNGFEPVLKAATKNLGDAVEIRIRDNGTGIPPEVRDKIFNPFFTTKPAGEGTGLGLSMSHDIVVKQHGGTIDVATEPGAFTEFIITLPRRARGLAAAEGTVN